MFADRLQKTTKVGLRLQSLLMPLGYCYQHVFVSPLVGQRSSFLRLQKLVVSAFFITKVSSIHFFSLQKFVASAIFHYKSL